MRTAKTVDAHCNLAIAIDEILYLLENKVDDPDWTQHATKKLRQAHQTFDKRFHQLIQQAIR